MTAANTIRCAYKMYAAKQAWWRSDEFAILSRPRATPSWKAQDGLIVPVYENSDDERMERERGELVWQLKTFGGLLPGPAHALHDPDLYDAEDLTRDTDEADSDADAA